MNTHVYLVRHGESTWNEAGRVQGWGNPALSKLGHAQALAVARRMRELRLQRIYASPLLRAMQTAHPIAHHQKLPIVPVGDFREIGLGSWEGKHVRILRRRHAAQYETWLKAPSKAKIPQAEKIHQFERRVVSAFHHILEECQHAEMLAIVSHGGVIRAILAHVLGVPFDPLMRGISLGNTSITRVSKTKGRLAVTVLNDTAHLTKLPKAKVPFPKVPGYFSSSH